MTSLGAVDFESDWAALPTAGDLEEAAARRRHHVILNAADKTIRFDQPASSSIRRNRQRLRGRSRRSAPEGPRCSRASSAPEGDDLGLGAPPGAPDGNVTIQDPVNPQEHRLTVQLEDRALSVSGSYGKWFESGVRYSHIMDPAQGCRCREC